MQVSLTEAVCLAETQDSQFVVDALSDSSLLCFNIYSAAVRQFLQML